MNEDAMTLEGSRKRRRQGACDACKRRKSKCEGPKEEFGQRCRSCAEFAEDCTFHIPAKKRGPAPRRPSRPANGGHAGFNGTVFNNDSPESSGSTSNGTGAETSRSSHSTSSRSDQVELVNPRLPDIDKDPIKSTTGDEESVMTLSEWLEQLHINPLIPRQKFGDSGGWKAVIGAMKIKQETYGTTTTFSKKRPEFWTEPTWEIVTPDLDDPEKYTFPEPELLNILVDQYFQSCNTYLPLLHKPTLMREIARSMHYRDSGFSRVLLCVCAIGARYSDHPLNCGPGEPEQQVGWKWFTQIDLAPRLLVQIPRLYDLQLFCLAILFLQGSSRQYATWQLLGVGLRMAIDLGLHRDKIYKRTPNAHDELWKRAFWMLVYHDRTYSSELGRSCAINEEDIDADFPIDCDDEYWEPDDEYEAFHQPLDRPSTITGFILNLKLRQIQAYALRTVLASNKVHIARGRDRYAWEQEMLSRIDSALNRWLDAVPLHLRWDSPSLQKDDTFFYQSALLYAQFYHLRLICHRPTIFMGVGTSLQNLNQVPLAICTNAARAVANILYRQTEKSDHIFVGLPWIGFSAGIILLLSTWSRIQSDPGANVSEDMDAVQKCLDAMKKRETRWQISGRFWDKLKQLASVGAAVPSASTTSEPRYTSAHAKRATCPIGPPLAPTLIEAQIRVMEGRSDMERLAQPNIIGVSPESSDTASSSPAVQATSPADQFASTSPVIHDTSVPSTSSTSNGSNLYGTNGLPSTQLSANGTMPVRLEDMFNSIPAPVDIHDELINPLIGGMIGSASQPNSVQTISLQNGSNQTQNRGAESAFAPSSILSSNLPDFQHRDAESLTDILGTFGHNDSALGFPSAFSIGFGADSSSNPEGPGTGVGSATGDPLNGMNMMTDVSLSDQLFAIWSQMPTE